ncbi:MAG: TonB-dependent receptor [Bacteroidetes bacterium]|nr:TonB-dependent receptor [Bacteroidota bacterium]MBM3424313.1 TonB-dependent receptor [Bacteroidota bacterium]
MRVYILLFACSLCPIWFAQQGQVSGIISEGATGQSVGGAKIEVKLRTSGAVVNRLLSEINGFYSIQNLPFGDYRITVTMVSFDTVIRDFKLNQSELILNINMAGSLEFDEVRVIGNVVKDGPVPIAVTKISTQKIQEELGSRDLPMLLNGTAGVYATQSGGGDGDARINVRGFDQRNVGVMIDGVPVNDMENGWVYWSNWFGLDAITATMQVQRGLGATKIAMPSIGGTLNIITQGIGNKRGGTIKQEYGTGNLMRTTASYNTGILTGGWGLTAALSYKQATGWVEGTPSQGFFGYLKVSKQFEQHLLTLSAFAAPQQHGQRSFRQPIQYWSEEEARNNGATIDTNAMFNDMGLRYNQHWGYRTVNGKQEVVSERLNYYNKPQFTLKDFWKVNKHLSISNLAYASIGRGGGTALFNSSAIIRDSNNLIDWDTMTYFNQYNPLFGTPNIDAQYSPTEIKSSQILLSSVNNHFWVGYLGQVNYEVKKGFEFSAGLDARYYRGSHYQEVKDLLGGDYYVDLSDKNAASPMKRVGDKIAKNLFNANRDGLVSWLGAFSQVSYESKTVSAFVNLTGIGNGYQGIDYFQKRELNLGDTVLQFGFGDTITYNGQTYHSYSEGVDYVKTPWKYIPGFTIKEGVCVKFSDYASVFLNIGYLNRTPMFSNVIDNNYNKFFGVINNEKILAFEQGFSYAARNFGINLNGYLTNWKNKPFPYGVAVPDPNDPTETIRVNINGMDAIHMGGEIDIAWEIDKKVSTEFMFSMGDWFWNSSKTIIIPQYDSLEYTFNAEGVGVGDAAQTALSATVRYEPIKNLYFKGQFQYFDRYFSDFNPFSLQGANGGRQSWMMPSYYLVNFYAGYRFKIGEDALNLSANVINLLNTVFIADATNNNNGSNQNFDATSAAVMFGQGFRFNVSLSYQF